MPWEETRERLGKARSIGEQDDDLSVYVRVPDIRAALERIKELERLEVTDVAGWAARAEAAEAKLAEVVEVLPDLLSYVYQLELLAYPTSDGGTHLIVERAQIALAAAKGE